MLSPRAKQAVYLRALLDAALLCLAFVLAFLIRGYVPLPFLAPPSLLSFAVHFWLLAIAVPLFWALSRDTSQHRGASYLDELRCVATPVVYLGLLLGTAIFLFQAKSFSRAVFFIFLLLAFPLIGVGRILLRFATSRLDSRQESLRNLLIVGLSDEAVEVRRRIESHPEYRMRVVGYLAGVNQNSDCRPAVDDVLGTIDDLKRIVEDQVVDEVIFVMPPADVFECEQHIAWCEELGVTVHLRVDFVRTLFARTYPTELDGTPILTLSSTPRDPVGLMTKRSLDIAVSLAAVVVVSPLMLLSALAIRLTSAGPIIFSQERIGLNGRPFRLHKFRSMYQDAEKRRAEVAALNEVSGPVFKIANDPRVTPVGRWLRKFSIDELPQLWNVLVGDMSLVGPRPPLHNEVRQYQRWQKRRLSMKPGITCLWQVKGRSKIPFEDWMKLDLEYIDNWSLRLDFKILLRTIPAVVLAKGAR
jgi:exopolysaccharide biosynthesis polyprenyl glycosylphosphotransferase